MLVDVEFPAHLPAAVTVPVDALVDSGTRTSVYVEHGEGVFEPREVETGRRSDDQVEILHGVQPGERVVVAAAFLVDSESRLRAPEPRTPPTRITDGPAARPNSMATAKIVRDPVCGMVVDPSVAAASGNSLEDHGKKFYFCSPEHKRAFQKDPSASSSGHQGDD
jgi:YHS domain-containing protein